MTSMATCLYSPPKSHHNNNNSNTRHVPLDSFDSPAALANSSSNCSSNCSSNSIYSSNILISLDIPSPVRREQEQEQEQEQEHFPDFFVSRPQSAADSTLQVPLGRPRILRPARRRHKKNMTDMIGTTTAAEFDELPIAVRRKVCTVCRFLLPFLCDPETPAVFSEDASTNAMLP